MTGRGRSNLYDRDGETSVGCISFFARRIFDKKDMLSDRLDKR